MVALPRKKLVLAKRYYYFGIAMILLGLFCVYEYSLQEKSPRVVTASQAAALLAESNKHWVRLSGLQLDCAKAIEETKDGKVERTFYIATEETKQNVFIVENNGTCNADPSFAYQGVLERDAGDYIKKEIAGAGVSLPGGSVPHLSVGQTPFGSLQAAIALCLFGFLAMGGTWWSRNK